MRLEDKKKTKKKKKSEPESVEAQELPQVPNNIIVLNTPSQESDTPKLRTMGIIGEIEEEKTSDILYGMLMMKQTSQREVAVDPENPEAGTKIEVDPFEIIISTYGGSAAEMFGIYDTMRKIRKECPILTCGIGKVMSAGVLLLAAGTKGNRRIGENCRVMIHDIQSATGGDVSNIQNEFEEIKWTQERYIEILSKETDMTKNHIKKLLSKKVNRYISAQEAVEFGIADEVF
jgi:ATP-dependent Clp endopeptidase proteolytic subunit ClpP